MLSVLPIKSYSDDLVANKNITALKAAELGLSVSVSDSLETELQGQIYLLNLFFAEQSPCEIGNVSVQVTNKKVAIFYSSLQPYDKGFYSININRNFLNESNLYFDCKTANTSWMQYTVNMNELVKHNQAHQRTPK